MSISGWYYSDRAEATVDRLLSSRRIPFRIFRKKSTEFGDSRELLVLHIPESKFAEIMGMLMGAGNAKVKGDQSARVKGDHLDQECNLL